MSSAPAHRAEPYVVTSFDCRGIERVRRPRSDSGESQTADQLADNLPVYSVYMLRCGDGSLYTGIARDVEERVTLHNSGKGAKYTASRLPVTLVYSERTPTLSAALKREYQIKTWSRSKKQALIAGDRSSPGRL